MRTFVLVGLLSVGCFAAEARAQWSIADPSGAFTVPSHSMARPWNPPIAQQQTQGSYYWCPYSGRYLYRQGDSHTTYSSALNPNRGHVDPGSMRYSTRWVWTPNGWAQQRVQSWTSFGRPHSNTLQTNPDGSQHGAARRHPGQAPRGR